MFTCSPPDRHKLRARDTVFKLSLSQSLNFLRYLLYNLSSQVMSNSSTAITIHERSNVAPVLHPPTPNIHKASVTVWPGNECHLLLRYNATGIMHSVWDAQSTISDFRAYTVVKLVRLWVCEIRSISTIIRKGHFINTKTPPNEKLMSKGAVSRLSHLIGPDYRQIARMMPTGATTSCTTTILSSTSVLWSGLIYCCYESVAGKARTWQSEINGAHQSTVSRNKRMHLQREGFFRGPITVIGTWAIGPWWPSL